MIANGFNIRVFKVGTSASSQETELAECLHNFDLKTGNEGSILGGGVLLTGQYMLPVVCEKKHDDLKARCISRMQSSDQPGQFLMQTRAGASSLVVNGGQGLWLTGGFNPDTDKKPALMTSELVMLDNNSMSMSSHLGPQLPRPLKHHCLASIGPGLAMLIGGQDDNAVYRQESFALRSESGGHFWGERSMLVHARARHACSTILDGQHHQILVIAAGGETAPGIASRTVNILPVRVDHELPTVWEEGPSMPQIVGPPLAGVSSADRNRLFVIGQEEGGGALAVLKLECTPFPLLMEWECHWSKVVGSNPAAFISQDNVIALVLPPPDPTWTFAIGSSLEREKACDIFATGTRGTHHVLAQKQQQQQPKFVLA